ncbi:uncharacterized protein Dwil_GK25240 [Drosophila willistoni]|uniref:Ribosome-binding factor A, mitochondrial n=1 Tax=Drosophila willistoni TaxID=7260 RepID=B4NEP5_DROWI|nr:putative ribosome-binding factor A, mitochondrial [Drosophila willistoni]EDW82214.1 uncharacterized protein Dwil_GK25240 [Drosophila willistoni]
MLRNRQLILQQISAIVQPQRSKGGGGGSAGGNATRQSKILGKLFGNRLAGSKKRWYPGHEASSASGYQPPSVAFQSSQFGKSNTNLSPGSKHNTRRMAVLNKLFMTHITDLLASGQVSETILGRSLQVTRVKISPDFSCINVYWLAGDIEIEKELQRCSGQLRHELSQLRLMGEVPRIKFVHDKTGTNLDQVEAILRTLNLPKRAGDDNEEEELNDNYDLAQTLRREFYGQEAVKPTELSERVMPEMRHDVLGLDHRLIMDKILTKMRKSKQAWEQHHHQEQPLQATTTPASDNCPSSTNSSSKPPQNVGEFEVFLAKRRQLKSTPERKKYRRQQDDWQPNNSSYSSDFDNLKILSHEQRLRYTQEDYIVEEGPEKP